MNDYSQLIRQISAKTEKLLKKKGIAGLSIALVDGKDTVWEKGFGYADLENKIPASFNTRYLIGSTTKLFTGTAVMQLVERGLVKLDSPVADYIPEFSVKTRFKDSPPITVRSLMTHHSGLPCDNFNNFYQKSISEKAETFRNTVDYLKDHYTCYPPDTIWSYSNLGTDLLGIIVERTSGMDFCKYISNNILEPLDMQDSATVMEPGIKKIMAKTYEKGRFEEEHFLRDLPAGAIISTVSDMAHFMKMVLNGGSYNNTSILGSEYLSEMLKPQYPGLELDAGLKMGLNWMLEWPYLENAGKVCWHDGSSVHYCSLLVVLPDQKLGISLLSNSSAALPEVLRSIAVEAFEMALAYKKVFPATEKVEKGPAELTPERLTECEGVYATVMGQVMIKRVKGELRLGMKNMKFKMYQDNDGWFSLKLALFGSIPVMKLGNMRINVRKIGAMKALQMEQKVARHEFRQSFGKELIKKEVPEAWKNRTGIYKAEDIDNTVAEQVELSLEDDILNLRVTVRKMGRLCLILETVNADEAVIQGLGRFAGDTVTFRRDERGETLELAGLLFRKGS